MVGVVVELQLLSSPSHGKMHFHVEIRDLICMTLRLLRKNKDASSLKNTYTRFKVNLTLDQEPAVLMYFSTGLFSGDVNLDCALEVGTISQQSLDGGCVTDKMSSKIKVKNLAHLRKPVCNYS